MPSFDTPESINVVLDYYVGDVRIVASDRADTVVEVRPNDPNDDSDVQAAQQIKVDYANGELRVTGPKRTFDFSKKSKAVNVDIELPSGSRLDAHLVMGGFRVTGRLGDTRIKSTGEMRLERTGALRLHTGLGNVSVDRIDGDAEVSTGSGKIQLGEVEGGAVIRNANGDTAIDVVTGDVRVKNANGDIDIDRALAGADVKTANGKVRLGEVVRGSITLGTAAGALDIGIAEGTAAWLEISTGFGKVHNQMEQSTSPGEATETVEVRGRTGFGDILIHRA
ncbi:DUF4097 family beta strand repeat-containing protein [Actinoplanes sp. CA-131856]